MSTETTTTKDTPPCLPETKLEATVFFWPFVNFGLGKTSVLIQEREEPKRQYYLSFPLNKSQKDDQDYLHCLTFKLPLKGNVTYDAFLEKISQIPYYLQKNNTDLGKKDSNKNYSCINSTCTHAVLTALSYAGYIEERTRNYPWETPYAFAKNITEQLQEKFLNSCITLLSDSFKITNELDNDFYNSTFDNTFKEISIQTHFSHDPIYGQNKFEHFDINKAVRLLYLIRLFKKINSSQGHNLENQLEQKLDPLHFVCINLLSSIYEFSDTKYTSSSKNSPTRWDTTTSLFKIITNYIHNLITAKKAQEECSAIIKKNHGNGSEITYNYFFIFINILCTLLTAFICNIIFKITTNDWFPFPWDSIAGRLNQIIEQLEKLVELDPIKLDLPEEKIKQSP